MAISMLKIRRPLGRLIFNMGIAIPGKTVFLIETAPRRRTEVDNPSEIHIEMKPYNTSFAPKYFIADKSSVSVIFPR